MCLLHQSSYNGDTVVVKLVHTDISAKRGSKMHVVSREEVNSDGTDRQGGSAMVLLVCTKKGETHNNDECRGTPARDVLPLIPVESFMLKKGTDVRVAVG